MLNCKEQSFPFYTQVKNPFPCFTPPEGKETLPFCHKLMKKATRFTELFTFELYYTFARARGKRKRKPPKLRRAAINALMQALCFHYDPLANRVNATITTMAMECGLATESKKGHLSITRATRALKSLAEDTGLITYETTFDEEIGCNLPSNIQFTPALFDMLDISPEALASERNSRAEWENQKREKQGLPRLSLEELAKKAFFF
ncbi:TPA: incFII family plasmid replication initiator RepA, partial [Raoultella ornithinolytica]|nr:incFII family plasmid replication initiator RepA [Raoultella ornithinolytica]HAT1670146.1 incFII family plasmid replication initiator RepA [Raoultella ornithinolytica]